ncbi:MAG: hypothetical protein ACREJ2_19080, partial [Planctomycetota bacterium]
AILSAVGGILTHDAALALHSLAAPALASNASATAATATTTVGLEAWIALGLLVAAALPSAGSLYWAARFTWHFLQRWPVVIGVDAGRAGRVGAREGWSAWPVLTRRWRHTCQRRQAHASAWIRAWLGWQ